MKVFFGKYDENYLNSITLSNIKTASELRKLVDELAKANKVVTDGFRLMFQDYVISVHGDYDQPYGLSLADMNAYRAFVRKIQDVYNYVLYLHTFENPFK